jgi:carboxymethylenebutenolidase
MTGGIGRAALTDFYRDHFIFSNPDDASLQVVSRTVGPDRIIGTHSYRRLLQGLLIDI